MSQATTPPPGPAEPARPSPAMAAPAITLAGLAEAAGRIEQRLAAGDPTPEEIRGIASAIEAIASQTSLLALDAAIGATRAGAAKALAAEASRATLEIGTAIAGLSDRIARGGGA